MAVRKDGGVSGGAGGGAKSAYQLAVDNGYSGSVNAWLASLTGMTGAREAAVQRVQPGQH